MTDLRDQLADYATRRQLCDLITEYIYPDELAYKIADRILGAGWQHPARAAIPLTDRHGIGHVLHRLRHTCGMSLDGLAARLGISRSGAGRREAVGYLPASALIDHLDALGYDLVAVPRAGTPDRRPA